MRLFKTNQRRDTLIRQALEIGVLTLIVYSLVTLPVETLPDLPRPVAQYLKVSEIVVTLLFTLEYLLRIVNSRQRLKYVFSFYGIVDLIAILPFYLALGIDLRGFRAFRLFRIFRLLKLKRYSKAIDRFATALSIAWEEIVIFLFATATILYLSAVGIYYFEHTAQPSEFKSVLHCLWWSVATLTTVGYGDGYPITVGGKIFTFVILMMGLGIVAIPAGLIASALAEARKVEEN